LLSITSRQSASSISKRGFQRWIAALATTMSILPNCCSVRSAIVRSAPMSRMSARTVSTRRPSARIIFAVSSNSSGVAGTALDAEETGPAMSTATMSAPFAAISTAMARPIPLAAPVTTATFPARLDPRPATTGPELWEGDGSGIGLPASSFGALSV
jgi:hypothetical protein